MLRSSISICAAVFFLGFVSPQVGLLGRGLRTGLPAIMLAVFLADRLDGRVIARAARQLSWILVLGLLFIIQVFVRFWGDSNEAIPDVYARYCIGPVLLLVGILLFLIVKETGKREVRLFGLTLLLGWTVSLTLGVPWLLSEPGVARLTMGNLDAAQNTAIWAPLGVGEFGDYSALAICFMPMVLFAMRLKGLWRVVTLLGLAGSAVAVLLSTFTMASVLLLCSILALLIYWVIHKPTMQVARVGVVLGTVVALALSVAIAAEAIPQVAFVYDKTARLVGGIGSEGLASGDETGRGQMFVSEMEAFARQPFLGSISGITNLEFGGGHSSLGDSLVLFGLIGSVWYGGVLVLLFRHTFKAASCFLDRYAIVATWLIFLGSGVLNPTWYSPGILGCMFVFTTLAITRNENLADNRAHANNVLLPVRRLP